MNNKEPMVIISASGMAETGRIVHHIKNNIENPKNTICIVSWQAPNTMGRRLADREPQVNIFGEVYKVKSEIATIGGLLRSRGTGFAREICHGRERYSQTGLPGAWRRKTSHDLERSFERTKIRPTCIILICTRAWICKKFFRL